MGPDEIHPRVQRELPDVLAWSWWLKSWTAVDNVHSQPRRPTASWAASKAVWPAGRGR